MSTGERSKVKRMHLPTRNHTPSYQIITIPTNPNPQPHLRIKTPSRNGTAKPTCNPLVAAAHDGLPRLLLKAGVRPPPGVGHRPVLDQCRHHACREEHALPPEVAFVMHGRVLQTETKRGAGRVRWVSGQAQTNQVITNRVSTTHIPGTSSAHVTAAHKHRFHPPGAPTRECANDTPNSPPKP